MLKRQGLTPVDVWFGEVKPHRRPMLELGDMVQTRRGELMFFAGVSPDGSAILGKDEKEAERLHKQVIEDRKHHSSRAALDSSLMLQPDYGQGDAAVPDGRKPPCQQGFHPCQHGLPCECGGGCGGKKADGESYMSVQALQSMRDHAEDLLGQVQYTSDLPDWVEAKLTRAAQTLNDVYEYMNHGKGQYRKLRP